MKAHVAIVVSAVMLFAPLAQAMEIRQFDRMSGDDQIKYIDKLTDSVEDASKNDPALLARVKRFFMKKQAGEAISGMGRFELNLSLARIADLQAAEKNPKVRRLELEDVMYATLGRSGIVLDKHFRPDNFQPQKPLAQKFLTREDADKALAQTQAWIARTVEPEHTFSHGGPQTGLSGFSDNEKAIAFFLALAAIGTVVGKASGPSDGNSAVYPFIPVPRTSWTGAPCYLAPVGASGCN
jgi:hypothetical protein